MPWWSWLLLCLAAFVAGAGGVWLAEVFSRRRLEADLARAVEAANDSQRRADEREQRLSDALRDMVLADDAARDREAESHDDSLGGAWDRASDKPD